MNAGNIYYSFYVLLNVQHTLVLSVFVRICEFACVTMPAWVKRRVSEAADI